MTGLTTAPGWSGFFATEGWEAAAFSAAVSADMAEF
jgi:hypothetical protein